MFAGVRLEDKKDASLVEWIIRRPSPPSVVFLPLEQGPDSAELRPVVACGQQVKEGETIAVPQDENGVALHASISGHIASIDFHEHPVFGEAKMIEIQANGSHESVPEMGREREGWRELPREALLSLFREMGLVDLSPGMKPLHRTLIDGAPAVSTLILNGCEPEPYVTSDYTLVLSRGMEILRGAEILRRAAGAGKVVIMLRKDELEAIEMIRSKIFLLKMEHMEVQSVPAVYPHGTDEMLQRDDCIVFNLATGNAVYEAVALQKPLLERVVTMGGECIVESRNIWARNGALFEDCFRSCRGLLRQPMKVLMGGPMKGYAQESLAVPVVMGTQAILALPKEVVKPDNVEACIRCGDCNEACPVEISPAMITLAAEREQFELARDYGVEFCIDCGNCTYVCPSKRPMAELIQYAAGRTA